MISHERGNKNIDTKIIEHHTNVYIMQKHILILNSI